MFWLIGYILTIILANFFIKNIGIPTDTGVHLLPVWFGVMAPSGTLLAGLGFTFRDKVQDILGKRVVILAILLGAALSAFISPGLAVASGGAFLISEIADFFVYTPLKEKSWIGAVVISNTVGLIIDSIFFLYLASIPMFLLPGQIIGKLWSTVVVVIVYGVLRWYSRSKLDGENKNSLHDESQTSS